MEENTSSPPNNKFKTSWIRIFINKYGRPDIIGLIALALSIASTCNDCKDREQEERHHQLQTALSYRPILNVVKTEHISSSLKADLSKTLKLNNDTSRIYEIPASLEIKFRIKIANNGNASAMVVGEFYLDTTSGDMIINKILKANKRIGNFEKIPESYYPNKQIYPGDTVNFWHNFKIQFVKNDTFTIHAVYLYENEAGQVFETYYHERFIYFPVPLYKININDKTPIETNDILKSIDKNQTTIMYTKEEAVELYESIQSVLSPK